ncbi:hypothetical protein J4458_06115 [Candidatus Woesearchaeota archaeon]|nr:hypothetical protein [Candidatus Woesearchaeota archaeon]
MAGFQYSKAISDSFRLVFNNPSVFVPLLLSSILGLLLYPMYFKIIGPDSSFNIAYLLANPGFLLLVVFSYIALLIIGYLMYGWTFGLIGQLVSKGRTDLAAGFKNAKRKGMRFFLVSLLLFLVFVGFMVAFMILSVISGIFLSAFSGLLVLLLVAALIVGLVILVMSTIYVVPLLSLEELGTLETIKQSFRHFRSNKLHSLALLCIVILFGIAAALIVLAIMFSVTGLPSSEAISTYMLKSPFKYAMLSFFTELPVLALTVWGFVFITIAYSRSKKKAASSKA